MKKPKLTKKDFPNKCSCCGSKNMKLDNNAYIGVENVALPNEKQLFGQAMECLDCGTTNTIDGEEIRSYGVTDYASSVRKGDDEVIGQRRPKPEGVMGF